uniref:Retrovirus-related Pol polyprotein from transposon TNT 1-94 n=1 Tax=Aceria tosichella TaxID=561515 RepID=A0A6G1SKL6_9ACAR
MCRALATPLEVGHSLNRPETIEEPIFDCPHAELVGSLNYLATRTRPDIAYALSVFSKYIEKPREQHWKGLKRVLRYLQGTLDYGLFYQPVENPYIKVYCDADYGGDHESRRSTSGMIGFLNSGPISYKAQQQQTVTMSTTEAEYIASALGVKELMWITTFIKELGLDINVIAIARATSGIACGSEKDGGQLGALGEEPELDICT